MNYIGERTLLTFLLLTGTMHQIAFAVIISKLDYESSVKKMCYHWSDTDLDILKSYFVSLIL